MTDIENKLANCESVDFMPIKVIENEIVVIKIVNVHLDARRVENDEIVIAK